MNNGVEYPSKTDGIPYEAIKLSHRGLRKACADKIVRPENDQNWSKKPQFSYLVGGPTEANSKLLGYLYEIGVHTIVVEGCYVDRDFMDDFAHYYVKCFHRYDRFCKRLHFFNFSFTTEDLRIFLQGESGKLNQSKLQEGYKGFIVVKPLPLTFLGRTCLTTYDEEADDGCTRHFTVTRDYEVGFFGTKLVVKKTLAFQEQDAVLAACATTALWTAFQKTSDAFNHYIPSPAQITESAAGYFVKDPKTFPSRGLTTNQIFQAIKSVDLSVEAPFGKFDPYDIADIGILVSAAYGFLKHGLPVIIGFEFIEGPYKGSRHVVTAIGFAMDYRATDTGFKWDDGSTLNLRSYRMRRFYVHDDGVGPYSRLSIDYKENKLITGWKDGSVNLSAIPTLIAIPTYLKMRIPFEAILIQANIINNLLQWLIPICFGPDAKSGFEWEIYSTDVNHLKKDIGDDKKLAGKVREYYLALHFPRFIWRAIGRFGGVVKIDLLFDATDFTSGNFLHTVVLYDELREFFKKNVKLLLKGIHDADSIKILKVIEKVVDSALASG